MTASSRSLMFSLILDISYYTCHSVIFWSVCVSASIEHIDSDTNSLMDAFSPCRKANDTKTIGQGLWRLFAFPVCRESWFCLREFLTYPDWRWSHTQRLTGELSQKKLIHVTLHPKVSQEAPKTLQHKFGIQIHTVTPPVHQFLSDVDLSSSKL